MASTYTSNIRLTKQGDGDNPNTWGQILNDGVISLVDEAVAGYATVTVGATTSVTLTSNTGSGDQARSAILELTGSVGGTHSTIYVLIPNNSKSYVVRNAITYASAGADVILQVAGNAGVTIAPGATKFVITNGTSVYNVAPDTFSSAITVDASATFNATVSVSGTTHLKGAVSVGGAANFASTVTIEGAAHLQSTLSVAGAATFNSTVTVLGNAHVSAAVCASAFYGSGSNLTGLPSMPTGAIITWTVTAAPSGYLTCNGDAVSRSTYSGLFTIVSSLYGDGDGSSTFNIPDLRGKFQAGFRTTVDTGLTSVTADMVIGTTIGNTGGAQAVSLATAQIPSHAHALISVFSGTDDPGTTGMRQQGNLASPAAINTSVAGGGGVHSNIPPTIILNYVIKT